MSRKWIATFLTCAGRVLAGFLLALCAVTGVSLAQTSATVVGTIKDTTEAILPGVTITAKNVDTGIQRTVITDDQGRYRLSNLPMGKYQVSASLPGFKTEVRSGIELTVGREALVDFVLDLGEVTEEVTVTGEAPLLNTTSAEVGGLVERAQIDLLPLNSRDYSQLITLQAGAVQYRHSTGGSSSGFGNRIAVSGARTSSNAFSLDGVNISSSMGQLPAGVTGAALGVEAVREFQVLTSNYNAQHGRAAGANIVAITRSGTNEAHGSLYGYHRNDNLDARNFFDRAKPEFKRNQFGFGLGGPIVRDRSFFFGSYEGLRQRLGLTAIGRVPTAAARAGVLPNRTVTVDPKIVPYLNLYPSPNGRIFGDGTGEFIRTNAVPTDQDYFTVRLDHTFTDKYSIFGRLTLDDSDSITPDDLGLFGDVLKAEVRSLVTEFKALLSNRFVGVFRLGLNRNVQSFTHNALVNIPPSLSFIEGRPIGTILITGLSSITGLARGATPQENILTAPQAYAAFDYTAGRHALKFGVDVEWNMLAKNNDQLAGGEIRFGSLADFLTNGPPRRFRMKGPDRLADPFRTFTQWLYGFYVQDDLRATSRLTLNLGLRYGFTTVPTERYGRVGNVRFVLDPAPTLGDPFYDNDVLNFDPRLGFAWDATGDSKTSLRGGFGIFHEPLLGKPIFNTMILQPAFWNAPDPPVSQLQGLFPFVSRARLEELAKGPQSLHSFDFNAQTPYMVHYSLGLQRALSEAMVATATYTGTRGVHLVSRADFTVPVPTFLPDGRTFYAPESPILNANFGRYNRYGTGADSWYQGLQVGLRRRMSAGWMFQASYTFSKNLDTQSAHLTGETRATTVMNPFNFRQDKGLADTEVRHSFVGNWVYELPFGRDLTGFARGLLYGWSLSGIASLGTGSPTTVLSHEALTHNLIQEGSVRPDQAPGASNSPVLGGPDRYFDASLFVRQQPGFYGNLGRNTLIAPGLAMMDLSLVKRFNLAEEHSLEFRSEFFNLANRANFGYPATAVLDSRGSRVGSAGRITRTITTARQIQFALRYSF